MAGGLPSPGGGTRPIALLACDDNADARRAAGHLVNDVGVPAILGFYDSQELIALASSIFLPNDVLAMATLNRSSLVTGIPHPPGRPRLVWRTTINSAQTAVPLSRLVSDLIEPQLRATPGVIAAGESVRVAISCAPRTPRGSRSPTLS